MRELVRVQVLPGADYVERDVEVAVVSTVGGGGTADIDISSDADTHDVPSGIAFVRLVAAEKCGTREVGPCEKSG